MKATAERDRMCAPHGASPPGLAPIGRTTRVLHWTAAIVIASAFVAAWVFDSLPPGAAAASLVELHRSLGLVLLGLTVLRLGWRLSHPLPPLPATTPAWEHRLAQAVQMLLYLCLLTMPVLGWVGSNAQGDVVSLLGLVRMPDLIDADQPLGDLLFQVHEFVGFVILALLALHIAGALRHHFVKNDGVLRRMIARPPGARG